MTQLRTLLLDASQSVNLVYSYTVAVMVFFVGQPETVHHHDYISRAMTLVGLELIPFVRKPVRKFTNILPR